MKHQTYQPARTPDTEMQENLRRDTQMGCFVVALAALLFCRAIYWLLTGS